MTDLVDRVLSGETRAAARLCRVLDDRAPGYREEARDLYARAPRAYVVGVTGSPGAGKSTLVDRLVAAFRADGRRVGVVAVDPSSPYTGGAVLGDRIRMQRHFEDPDVFIRSVATRGAMGGLSRSTRDVVRVLEGWGAGVVLLETVGVGQDELDVTLVADTTVVVVVPGLGDDVQAVKAGILEVADVLVVNKADRPLADATVRDLENMLAQGALSREAIAHRPAARGHSLVGQSAARGSEDGAWTPPVLRTVATKGEGIGELVARLGEHRAWLDSGEGRKLRQDRARALIAIWLRDAIAESVGEGLGDALESVAERVLARDVDPYDAVADLVDRWRSRV